MESKGVGDKEYDDEKGEVIAPQKNLVMRFCEFAFKVLNQDMDEFFEDNMDIFDQDSDELACGRGETLEQYSVYESYLNELEIYLDEFASTEGYNSASDCFNEINELVLGDKENREKAMKELAAKMKESFEKWTSRFNKTEPSGIEGGDAVADGKTEDNEVDDVKGSKRHGASVHARAPAKHSYDNDKKSDGKEADDDLDVVQQAPPPVMMFFQPVSLDSMIQHVLNLTEYTTFSHIMRTKVKQRELYRILQGRVEEHPGEANRRQRDLDDCANLLEIYEELVDRICGLTPHQKMIQEHVRHQLKSDEWIAILRAGADEASITTEQRMSFKRVVMTACMAVWSMISVAQQMEIRSRLMAILPDIDRMEAAADVEHAAARFLKMAHEMVDDTEVKMLEALELHYAHHQERRRTMKGRGHHRRTDEK